MNLDVIVCTYNRSVLLRKAILSLLRAPVPDGLHVHVFVVDNNSPDNTASVVRELQQQASLPIHYVLETGQGSSYARNAGVAAGTAELIGMIDDDEEIEEHWFEVIHREFQDSSVQFIGGPYLPKWESPAPDWLPPGYHAVIGAHPRRDRDFYHHGRSGILSGGNSVVRRTVYEQLGGYSTRLGRTNKGLLSEEDADFYRRMLAAGLTGVYVPDLAIYHFIPTDRLTRSYHRRWAYWRGVSQGMLDREAPEPVTYLFGVPRHRIGRAIRSALAIPAHLLGNRGAGQAFANELATWDLAGFVHGRFFAKTSETSESHLAGAAHSPASGEEQRL